jgi:hypothetical protein
MLTGLKRLFLAALALASCQDPPRPQRATQPAPSAVPASPPSAPVVTSAAPSAAPAWQGFASTIEQKPGCRDYGVLLTVTWPSTPSRTTWLAETLRALPQLQSWFEPGGGATLSYILHGSRNYGTGLGNREGLVLHCADQQRCRELAGLYAQVHVGAKPQPFCGSIPGNTGGPVKLAVDKLLARARPFPHGVCARYRACLVATNQPVASCNGFELTARACAELEDCLASLDCLAMLPRNPLKPLWSDDAPPARPGRGDFF